MAGPGSRQTVDLWEGICCCHDDPTCEPMSGPITSGSTYSISGNYGQARLRDTTVGWCGHTGEIVTGAPYAIIEGTRKSRVGDQVDGCNIGVLSTGLANGSIGDNGGGCAFTDRIYEWVDENEEKHDLTYTEVDFANRYDDPDSDTGYNVMPPVIGRSPTASEVARSAALDQSPSTLVDDDSTATNIIDASTYVDCLLVSDPPPDDFQLSTNFTLADLSVNTALSRYRARAQHGLSVQEVVCNLQGWAENVGEPLLAEYNKFVITSGFRIGSTTSQHERGQAADIQYPFKTNEEIYDISIWIRDNINYDQLILEYGGNRPWIHISFKREGNRASGTYNKFGTRVAVGSYVWGELRYMV